ncbi:NUDIX domain-containing protein [Helicobacter ibis]|uniref:NUDIX domain-containing protein n=1 Tax=Helicobacter ibis TaxID=2962633 RepID=A0ABT4VC53_9HELI|nr:NUDIX domain-containing protein [Helicobacter ibis]MDA3968280.1 NUDIX domain-containing protein [Helicobacter ibis]
MKPKNITDIKFDKCEDSKYINPIRMIFKDNGKRRVWDIIEVHNSVATLLYHKDKDSFIFVKQFRPAVYLKEHKDSTHQECGYTYELCAGLMDKEKSAKQTAKEEILEECGYDVKLDNINEITEFYTAVGFAGSKQVLFYAIIDDSMKVNNGGGIDDENIEIIFIKKQEVRNFIFDKSYPKTSGAMFAVLWFLENVK